MLGPFLTELLECARTAEESSGHPVDMEWAIDERGLHILQSRPVKAFFSEDSTVWSNVNLAENFPNPLSPLAWSCVERFYSSYMKAILSSLGRGVMKTVEKGKIENILGIHRARVYYNLTNWLRIMRTTPAGDFFAAALNNYIGQKIPFDPESAGIGSARAHGPAGALLFFLRSIYRRRPAHEGV